MRKPPATRTGGFFASVSSLGVDDDEWMVSEVRKITDRVDPAVLYSDDFRARALAVVADTTPAQLWTVPNSRWRRWRWRRMRKRLEYRLFVTGGMWGSVEWQRVKDENNLLGVWR